MDNYKIETILVPTDFSETANKALEQAIGIAKKINAKLTLVHVVEPNLFADPVEMVSAGIVNQQMIEATEEGLKKTCEKIQATHKIKVEHTIYSGIVFDNIINASHFFKADMIIMGTHGASGIKEWLFGSNTFSVVRHSSIPVFTFNLHTDKTSFQKIVFPFHENLLTLEKIPQVISLTKIFNASILFFGYTNSKMTSAIVAIRKQGKALVEQFAKENIESSFSMSQGENYADEILEYANKENADIITIVSSKNHNVDTVFKSKPDKKLVNHSEIPVLCVPIE